MELHFLQTIWSDIIILKDGNNIAMIDTGFEKQFDAIKVYLDNLNVKKISFILLTHFHRDHYGSITSILKNYDVEKVYFKDYSALDSITAKGMPADDKYRENEYIKCTKMKETIRKYSKLIEVENIKSVKFGTHELKLYSTNNSIKDIYNDKNYQGTYHKIIYSENQNSLAVFFKVNGVNVLLGGDIHDVKSSNPKSNYVNYQVATSINEEIDIYKVPHHGTINCNCEKTLNIYKPKIAIITNEETYLKKESTIYDDLKNANKEVKILLTEKYNIVINISNTGEINYKKC